MFKIVGELCSGLFTKRVKIYAEKCKKNRVSRPCTTRATILLGALQLSKTTKDNVKKKNVKIPEENEQQ